MTESTKRLYEKRLTDKLQNIDITEYGVQTCWKEIRKYIEKAAEESMGKRKVNINSTNHTKPWFCREIKELAETKKRTYLQYKSNPSNEQHTKYIRIRNEVNSKIKTIKREYWSKFTSDMDYDMYGAQRKVWKMLKNRKKPVNEYVQTKGVPLEQWEKYFRDLYDAQEIEGPEVHETPPNALFENAEIKQKLTKLKNRKAPGTDNIPNEFLKYGGKELINKLTILFNKIITTGEVPDDWHKSITIPIFKKGQKTNPQNYRGITLLNTSMKLFTSLIKDKLETQITGREEQQGFRRGRSVTDAIFVMKQIKEKSLEYNKPAYICFVDLSKAFDRVRLGDVLEILQKEKIPPYIIKIIHHLNTQNTTKVKHGVKTTEAIPTPGGIRQGDSLSPFLFNLLMDQIIDEVTAMGIGFRMSGRRISMVCYADDAAILAETEDDLQRQLYKFHQISRKLNMSISAEKTKCMTISKDPIRCKPAVEDKIIEQVSQFTYLGIQLSNNHDPPKDLRSLINKSAAIAGSLRETVWANKYMRMDSKIKIYKTCVRPIMTYGIEAREDTNKTKSMLRVAEMKILRTIVGKTRRDRVRNTEVREQCEVQDVVRWGRQRRRQWHDHVRRMDENRLPKIALVGRPAGKRPLGRPPKRWKDSWQSTSQDMLQGNVRN